MSSALSDELLKVVREMRGSLKNTAPIGSGSTILKTLAGGTTIDLWATELEAIASRLSSSQSAPPWQPKIDGVLRIDLRLGLSEHHIEIREPRTGAMGSVLRAIDAVLDQISLPLPPSPRAPDQIEDETRVEGKADA